MGRLPESGVQPILVRDPDIFPLQDGVTYLDGWGERRTIGVTTGPDKRIAWTHQGVWYRRADGRAYWEGRPQPTPSPYDIAQKATT